MILIVDDTQENIFSLKSLLEINKFEVDTALSGEEALKKILRNTYSLVILDVQMPGMDGFEVAEAISGYSKSKDLPIIFLSAINTHKKYIAKGYDSGGIDYVTKPFDPDILLLKVKTFYRLSEQTRKLNAMDRILRQKVEERTAELVKANKELEASNDELRQFAFVASHDLQEPLRKIQTFSTLLRDKILSTEPESFRYLSKIIGSADRMRNLINELLNYSSLSAESYYEKTNIKEIINNILQDLELHVTSKNAAIDIGIIPDIEVIPGQIRHVFQNLISNALKFSRENTYPVITISGERIGEKTFDAPADPDGPYCRIIVSDNGIGFNEMYLDKIFTIFQRLNPPGAYEGTGIGLAIVKKIIDRHNGIITARSKEGRGATFLMILPVRQEISSTVRIL